MLDGFKLLHSDHFVNEQSSTYFDKTGAAAIDSSQYGGILYTSNASPSSGSYTFSKIKINNGYFKKFYYEFGGMRSQRITPSDKLTFGLKSVGGDEIIIIVNASGFRLESKIADVYKATQIYDFKTKQPIGTNTQYIETAHDYGFLVDSRGYATLFIDGIQSGYAQISTTPQVWTGFLIIEVNNASIITRQDSLKIYGKD